MGNLPGRIRNEVTSENNKNRPDTRARTGFPAVPPRFDARSGAPLSIAVTGDPVVDYPLRLTDDPRGRLSGLVSHHALTNRAAL